GPAGTSGCAPARRSGAGAAVSIRVGASLGAGATPNLALPPSRTRRTMRPPGRGSPGPAIHGRPPAMHRPVLYIDTILGWIDGFRKRVGRWPDRRSGVIPGTLGVTWTAVDQALKKGLRGLPGGSSLAKLLAERRGKRHRGLLPPYTTA